MRWELVGTRVLGPRHDRCGRMYSKDAVVGGGGSEEEI
jgi:hypothetical protein